MERYIGAKLKLLRQSRSWSQADLAKRLNKAVSTVSGYESDAHPIPTDVLINIADLFGISLDDLFALQKPETLSIQGLSTEQIDIVKRLIYEYQIPTNRSCNYSESQMNLLHDILYTFGKP